MSFDSLGKLSLQGKKAQFYKLMFNNSVIVSVKMPRVTLTPDIP